MPSERVPAHTNRLAGETSPYLLQHAHNPVDWYPWGAEALARARAEAKPIFLSIGYAACHWCHVMERESFEDEATAAELNADFVAIKVDREERPDLDAIYMDAVQAMTGGGGWPMSVFLTPDGQPFYGGTYFPDEPRHGMPAFRQVLASVAAAWRDERPQVEAAAARLTAALREQSARMTEAARVAAAEVGRSAPRGSAAGAGLGRAASGLGLRGPAAGASGPPAARRRRSRRAVGGRRPRRAGRSPAPARRRADRRTRRRSRPPRPRDGDAGQSPSTSLGAAGVERRSSRRR